MNTQGIHVTIENVNPKFTRATAERGDMTLTIDTINGMRFINADVRKAEYIETADYTSEYWRPFFIAIHNHRNNH
jgi:hypothetical protein